MSSSDAIPPEAMTAPRSRPTSRARRSRSGPPHEAVPLDGGRLEGRHALIGERGEGILRADAGGAFPPALAEGEAVADVEGDDDPVRAVGGHESSGEGGIAERGGPDDHARRTRGEHRRDRVLRPQPTGHLDGDVATDRIHDAPDDRRVGRQPRPRSVEVDDVQPARPRLRERRSDGDRVIGERGLPFEVALLEADDATAAQVDRRAGCRSRLSPSVHRVSVLAR